MDICPYLCNHIVYQKGKLFIYLCTIVPQFEQIDLDINLRKEKAFYQIVVKYVNPGTQEAAIDYGGFYPIGIGGP